jgi:hypothetical protein
MRARETSYLAYFEQRGRRKSKEVHLDVIQRAFGTILSREQEK